MAVDDEQHIDADAWGPYQDGELGTTELARMEAHLAVCADCRRQAREWQALRDALASYAPPAVPAAAAEAFRRRLAHMLPPRRAQLDAAPCLTPLALLVGHVLWQGLSVALGALILFGGGRALVPSGTLPGLFDLVVASSWWGAALGVARRQLAPVVPLGSEGTLLALGAALVGFCGLVAVAGLYTAWMLLWLRPWPAGQRA